jgi:hypothetical protein
VASVCCQPAQGEYFVKSVSPMGGPLVPSFAHKNPWLPIVNLVSPVPLCHPVLAVDVDVILVVSIALVPFTCMQIRNSFSVDDLEICNLACCLELHALLDISSDCVHALVVGLHSNDYCPERNPGSWSNVCQDNALNASIDTHVSQQVSQRPDPIQDGGPPVERKARTLAGKILLSDVFSKVGMLTVFPLGLPYNRRK